jgi:hypothetical protein
LAAKMTFYHFFYYSFNLFSLPIMFAIEGKQFTKNLRLFGIK